jgi:hypothetical protein
MGNVFAFSVDAFGVELASSALPLHSVFMFTSCDLLFIFFGVRPGFIHVWHCQSFLKVQESTGHHLHNGEGFGGQLAVSNEIFSRINDAAKAPQYAFICSREYSSGKKLL